MENVQSLGGAGKTGYAWNRNSFDQQARAWSTGGGQTRLDLVNFTYDHALLGSVVDGDLPKPQKQLVTPASSNGSGRNPSAPLNFACPQSCLPNSITVSISSLTGSDGRRISQTSLSGEPMASPNGMVDRS